MQEQKINPRHRPMRTVLRIVGPLVLLTGLGFAISGFHGVFTDPVSDGLGDGWKIFVGFPLIFVGGVMTMCGFAGAAARYAAGEMAPVGKDTFNYMAEGTSGGVRTVARSIGAGLSEGLSGDATAGKVRCPGCDGENDAEAKFCDQCGAELATERPCPACRAVNDADAKFCDACGKPL